MRFSLRSLPRLHARPETSSAEAGHRPNRPRPAMPNDPCRGGSGDACTLGARPTAPGSCPKQMPVPIPHRAGGVVLGGPCAVPATSREHPEEPPAALRAPGPGPTCTAGGTLNSTTELTMPMCAIFCAQLNGPGNGPIAHLAGGAAVWIYRFPAVSTGALAPQDCSQRLPLIRSIISAGGGLVVFPRQGHPAPVGRCDRPGWKRRCGPWNRLCRGTGR